MDETTPGAVAEDSGEGRPRTAPASVRLVLVAVILAVFAGIVLAKVTSSGSPPGASPSASPSITSGPNDATADYEAAVRSGKPIYLLFHSTS